MDIGLGLPIGDPRGLLDWADRADASPFSTFGLLDRLVHDNPDPLVALAAIAARTSRIRLQTEVLLGPLHPTAVLAKQIATLDRISGGRFTLGIGVGGREIDARAADTDFRDRGRRLDRMLVDLRRIWSGGAYAEGIGPIGPAPTRIGGPEVLIGAFAPVAITRVGRLGDGYLGADLPPAEMGERFRLVERSWSDAGRAGSPRLVAQVSVAFGPESVLDDARAVVGSYYAFTGSPDEYAAGILTTPQQIRAAIDGYADVGADEVMLYCWGSDPDQVDRLADIVG